VNTTESLTREHTELTELLPWYVNGTLAAGERQRLERHLESCAACRRDLELEHTIAGALTSAPAVEYLPAPSLKRLNERLDALLEHDVLGGPILADQEGSSPNSAMARTLPPISAAHRRRRRVLERLVAVWLAAFAIALAYVITARLPGRPESGGEYRTVTTSAPRSPEVVIRAVFAPSLSMGELKHILEGAGLRIVAGPTEAGVYSLAATTDRPVADSLAELRRHDAVRFAESTAPVAPARPESGAPAPTAP
jgi:hypothetical protein